MKSSVTSVGTLAKKVWREHSQVLWSNPYFVRLDTDTMTPGDFIVSQQDFFFAVQAWPGLFGILVDRTSDLEVRRILVANMVDETAMGQDPQGAHVNTFKAHLKRIEDGTIIDLSVRQVHARLKKAYQQLAPQKNDNANQSCLELLKIYDTMLSGYAGYNKALHATSADDQSDVLGAVWVALSLVNRGELAETQRLSLSKTAEAKFASILHALKAAPALAEAIPSMPEALELAVQALPPPRTRTDSHSQNFIQRLRELAYADQPIPCFLVLAIIEYVYTFASARIARYIDVNWPLPADQAHPHYDNHVELDIEHADGLFHAADLLRSADPEAVSDEECSAVLLKGLEMFANFYMRLETIGPALDPLLFANVFEDGQVELSLLDRVPGSPLELSVACIASGGDTIAALVNYPRPISVKAADVNPHQIAFLKKRLYAQDQAEFETVYARYERTLQISHRFVEDAGRLFNRERLILLFGEQAVGDASDAHLKEVFGRALRLARDRREQDAEDVWANLVLHAKPRDIPSSTLSNMKNVSLYCSSLEDMLERGEEGKFNLISTSNITDWGLDMGRFMQAVEGALAPGGQLVTRTMHGNISKLDVLNTSRGLQEVQVDGSMKDRTGLYTVRVWQKAY